jgi:iron complex transport system ATP-binding protein
MGSDVRAEAHPLEARGVVVERSGRPVLAGVDLEVAAGEILAIVGPNGAGKTTLLKALLGLLPYRGSIRASGREVSGMRPIERARAVAYVPQQSRLDSALTVEHVVRQGRFAHPGRGEARDFVREAMDRTGVTAYRDRPFPTLSLGEQRRVLVARAVASGAPSLLLDEPDAFLDVGQALDLFELLAALRADGRALVLVLHDLERAYRFADRVLLLAHGSPVAYGLAVDALGNDVLADVFGVEATPKSAMGFRRLRSVPDEVPS